MTEPQNIVITRGDWTMFLRPDIGASIAGLSWRDHDILRPALKGATRPEQMGNFPLVPYANRIARGKFRFAGRDVVLASCPAAEPHALHGVGWQRPWAVVGCDADRIDLALAADRSQDWPWNWTALYGLQLKSDGLAMTLSITSQDSAPMPAGLGLHPYFPLRSGTTLRAQANEVWLNGPDDIPLRKVPARNVVDWNQDTLIGFAPFVDNAYCGWSRAARLTYDRHTVSLTASSNARWLQVYAPRGEDYICIEPMTHRPDAINAPQDEDAGISLLMPGQSLSMSMQITAEPTSPGMF